MSTEILFPKIGFTMNEGTLSQWLVTDGDQVQAGQVLYTLESDKAVEEVEAPASGRVRIIGQPGTVYKVGDLVGTIE
jgi:pyruvate/2-oxoglutarate dehydrogenase complex dihydrolipoamide acyltransferase (E2) component